MALTDLVPNPNDPLNLNAPRIPAIAAASQPVGPPPQLGPMPGLGSAPSSLPALRPLVTSPRQQQEQELQQKISAFENPAAPKTGFWHKLGQISAKIGNIAGDVLAPEEMALIPGTQLHNQLQNSQRTGELDALQKQDVAEQGAASESQLRGAQSDYYQQHGQSLQQHQVTPDEAAAMGVPELAGSMMDPKAWESLIKQQGVNQTKVTTNAATNQTKLTAANLEAMNKIQPHITVEVGGEGHVMERDPKTGAYSIDRGIAPANYASMLPEVLGTKTTELLGPDNVMHRYQYNPATKTYSDDIGAAPTGTAQHQIFQGAAIEQLGPQVINDINANRQILGNMDSYYKQWLAGTPVSDPAAAQLMTELMSFAAMQPALHGFRSTNALEAFEKMIGGLAKNPDATIATINGIMKTPEAFTNLPNNSNVHMPAHGGGKPNAAPTAGTVENGYRFKGGDPGKQENWEQVK